MYNPRQKRELHFALSLILAGLSFFLGLGVFSSALLAAVIAAFYAVGGPPYYIYGSAAALAVGFLFCRPDIIEILIFLVGILPLAFVLGAGLRSNKSFLYIFASSSLTQVFSSLLSLSYVAWARGLDIDYILIGERAAEMRAALGDAPAARSAEMLAVLDGVESVGRLVIPSILLISCAALAYLTIVAAKLILKSMGRGEQKLPSFNKIRLSKASAVIFLCILAAAVLFGAASPEIVNILLVCVFVFALSGVSVADYFLKKRRVMGIFRFLIFVVLLPLLAVISPIINPLIIFAGLGVTDSFKNLRRLNLKEEEDGKE